MSPSWHRQGFPNFHAIREFILTVRVGSLMILVASVATACGSPRRKKDEEPAPQPTVRSVVPTKTPAWETGSAWTYPNAGTKNQAGLPLDPPLLQIFLPVGIWTASDGDDFEVSESIQSWIGHASQLDSEPEP